jgi:hypothetical protein
MDVTKVYCEASNNGNFSQTQDFFNLTILGTNFLKVVERSDYGMVVQHLPFSPLRGQ